MQLAEAIGALGIFVLLLAWRRRKVKAAHTLMGWDHRDDSMVAVTVSVKPRL